MTKSSKPALTGRINAALALFKKRFSTAEIVRVLIRRYGVSGRQAYRYLQEAEKAKGTLPVPEQKVVFTVKLPVSLAGRFRQQARSTGESLSALVTRALEDYLKRGGHG